MKFDSDNLTKHPGYYSGVDAESLSFDDRIRPRSQVETYGVKGRMAKRKSKDPYGDMVVPGSVRNFPFKDDEG